MSCGNRALRRELAFIAAVIASTAVFAVDDGNQIQIHFASPTLLKWLEPQLTPDTHQLFNIYTGDLQVLRDTGDYTQSTSPSGASSRTCDVLGDTFSGFFAIPEPGQCLFAIMSGTRAMPMSIEGGLGTDGQGQWRANSRPCHSLFDTTPPEPPGPPVLVTGHCRAIFVTTSTPSPSHDIYYYRATIGTTPGYPKSGWSTYVPSYQPVGALTIYAVLQAVDWSGNVSAASADSVAIAIDTTTPSQPEGSATAGNNAIQIDWAPVTTNVENVPGDPDSPVIRDLAQYRIYRGDSPSGLGSSTPIASVSGLPRQPTTWTDTSVVNCHPYYYAATAVDHCGFQSAPSSEFHATTSTTTAPRTPANVRAAMVDPTVAKVVWDPVTSDVDGQPIFVGHYDVYRSPVMARNDPAPPTFPSVPVATVPAASFVDVTLPPLDELSQTVHYFVKAKDECVNESAASPSTAAECAFSGTVQIDTPLNNASVAGGVPVTVRVVGGTETFTGVSITYKHAESGATRTFVSSTAGTNWTDIWVASPAGAYTITATVTSARGCRSSAPTIAVKAGSVVGCCVSMFPTTDTAATCAGGATKCKEVSYRIGNNQCLTPVSLDAMAVNWVDYSGNHPRWQSARFNSVEIAPVGSWTTTYGGSPNEFGLATRAGGFNSIIPYAAPMTTANTTRVTYVFDTFTDSGIGANRKVNVFVTNQFRFTLLDSAGNPTDLTTTCDMPSLTVN